MGHETRRDRDLTTNHVPSLPVVALVTGSAVSRLVTNSFNK